MLRSNETGVLRPLASVQLPDIFYADPPGTLSKNENFSNVTSTFQIVLVHIDFFLRLLVKSVVILVRSPLQFNSGMPSTYIPGTRTHGSYVRVGVSSSRKSLMPVELEHNSTSIKIINKKYAGVPFSLRVSGSFVFLRVIHPTEPPAPSARECPSVVPETIRLFTYVQQYATPR